MNFTYGTKEEHISTYQRTKRNNPKGFSVWSGDIRRNPYLGENLQFLREEKLATVVLDNSDPQESYFEIKWLEPPMHAEIIGPSNA